MAPDRIQITDLSVRCIIGVDEWERRTKLEVLVDLELRLHLESAGASDDLSKTIDYRSLAGLVIETMSATDCHLLEAFAERVADLCLSTHRNIESIRVRVRKPSAFAGLGTAKVAVELTRKGEPLIRGGIRSAQR